MRERLGNDTGVIENAQILERIVNKVVWNLQFYASVPSPVTPSLSLLKVQSPHPNHSCSLEFYDVTNTFVSSKALVKFQTVQSMLTGNSTDFAFLNEPANSQNQTLFYTIISRLLFTEDVFNKFKSFVAPMHQVTQTTSGMTCLCRCWRA